MTTLPRPLLRVKAPCSACAGQGWQPNDFGNDLTRCADCSGQGWGWDDVNNVDGIAFLAGAADIRQLMVRALHLADSARTASLNAQATSWEAGLASGEYVAYRAVVAALEQVCARNTLPPERTAALRKPR